jgi:uncharacterized lipoprotein YddW (UPF0748 family)
MRQGFLIFCFSFLLSITVCAQPVPQREFRAAWMATVANIDWPSTSKLSVEEQKAEIIYYFDLLQRNNFNAVIVQVRPVADAFYPSQYEPWSRYLTGTTGQAPNPYYDPLAFMIEEAHKRCIEFHAWFNPYRALMNKYKNYNPPNHVTKTHPGWFVNYGKKKYFNPGLPAVQDYCIKIVTDVVKRYDIDAVHMDDYFYPYRIGKSEFPDLMAYRQYNMKSLSRDDWRRDNVNKLVRRLNIKIKSIKPYVKFGISPFGVWRNASVDSLRGSNTNAGQTNYDDLFANVLLWQQEGWIDYCLPQLYWESGHPAVDYGTLIAWWNKNAFNRHMYIGHAIYKLGNRKPAWKSLDEIEHQIDETRHFNKVQGSAFYSIKFLKRNVFGINQMFRDKVYKTPALLPQMKWLPKMVDNALPPRPLNVQMQYGTNGMKMLKWRNEKNEQYAIYEIQNTRSRYNKKVLGITRGDYFVIDEKNSLSEYQLVKLDRLHNEGEKSNLVH